MSESVSKEDKILAASRPLFERYGARKTTIDDIARDAGLGKGTIYLYFKSKEEIFLTVVRREMNELLAKIRTALRREPTAEAKLKRYMAMRVGHLGELAQRLGYDMRRMHEHHHEPGMEELLHDNIRQHAELLRSVIEEGVELGELTCADPDHAGLAIVSMTFAMCMDWRHHGRPLRVDHKIDVMSALFLDGLRPRRL